MQFVSRLTLCVALVAVLASAAGCPYGFDKKPQTSAHHHIRTASAEYVRAAQSLDWDSVVADIKKLMASNFPDIYPADDMLDGTTSYGPFFIRQAWHCAGSYRQTDGLGGCAGGRQRFNPELSWPDNTNLDKAKRLLWPVKEKYGLGLSWGDLIILAGKLAIEDGGFPFIGFCAGRPDQEDGSQSTFLGPTTEQEKFVPCPLQGDCGSPFGATTIGLIYVNPQGYMGDWTTLNKTAQLINGTFGRMSMDAEETVALIGGGHSFGKTHGACRINESNFLSPEQDPANPWPIDICKNGTFTTGFEGYWTNTPRKWGNQFFQRLTGMTFTAKMADGGNHQYQSASAEANKMMLPSDISLLHDPTYKAYAEAFANNFTYLTEIFGAAWYKLTTRDSGPITRCLNISIGGKWQLPPPQAFQYPLPPPPSPLADFTQVAKTIRSVLYSDQSVVGNFAVDVVNGKPYWGALFTHLAFQCASTYRSTDHIGGCNGARVRLSPQKEWLFNSGMDTVLGVLQQAVKAQYGASLSFADLIVLAGSVAIEDAASNITVPFCGGRSDATESYGDFLKQTYNFSDATMPFHWDARVYGLNKEELVALQGRMRSPNQMARMDYVNGTWAKTTNSLNVLDGAFFRVLLNETWAEVDGPNGPEYVNGDGSRFMTPTDMRILWEPDLKNIAQMFASDDQYFLQHFVSGWTKFMNADRYNGPTGNLCN